MSLRDYCALPLWTSRGFKHAIEGRGLCQASVRLHIVALNAMYSDINLQFPLITLGGNPFADKSLRPPARLTRPSRVAPGLSDTEVCALFSVAEKRKDAARSRALLALLFGAGLRGGEVLGLEIGDVGRVEGGVHWIRLRNTKSSNYARHSIAPWVADAVYDYVAGHSGDGALFGMTYPTLWRWFKALAREARVNPEASVHSGRRTAINKLLNAGVGHKDVMTFSRHGSVAMVERYAWGARTLGGNPGLRISYADE